MPAQSKAQQRLMGAALGGAQFAAAKKIRQSMPASTIKDFARGSMKGKPTHVPAKKHPHQNLGAWLHPKKKR